VTNFLHGFLALLAGFATMAILVIVMTAVLQKSVPGWVGTESRPRPAYVVVNLGYSFLAAAAGGYVTAWIANLGPLRAVLALSIVVLVLGAISALHAKGRQPLWYQMTLLIISSMGVVAGGLVRLRVTGML
jgi:hypothetical protein